MVRTSVLLLVAAFSSFAQMKVAIINSQASVMATSEIKSAQAALEAKFKPRTAQVEALQKEVQDLQAQMQSGKLTPQQEQEVSQRGTRRQRELQRMTEDLQGEVDRERQEVLGRIGGRMQEVVQKLSEERGFDLVIDVSNTVYFKPALDITKDATAAYDKAYPAK